jgi:hypothetical protein
MKVALCLSGQPRFYKRGYEFINKFILNVYQPDIFMHVWFDKSKVGQPYLGSCWNNGRSDIVEDMTIENLQQLYNPIRVFHESEKFNNENLPRIYDSNKARQESFITFSMFYSVLMANKLKIDYEIKNNFKYDCVLRMRFDWALDQLINLNNFDLNKLYCPNDCGTQKSINDQFAFSKSENMDIYSNTYNFIDDYWVNDRIKLIQESLLYHHLDKNGVEINPLNIRFKILR